MQKKNKKQTKPIKQIIIYTIIIILLLLLVFAEDIIKLANKNKIGLLENNPNETMPAEPNVPVISAGMIPVKWDGTNWIITTSKDEDWYDYKTGKPAYIMLNDGYYRSEIERDVGQDQLMENNVGVGVPDDPSIRGTIFAWIPRFAYNKEGEIQYIKDVDSADETLTIPDLFTHAQTSETSPDFLLTGIWLEKDLDYQYSNKIIGMNQEDSIYGFIKNTIAVSSDQPTQNIIQTYITNLVGVDASVDLFDNITSPNRIILKIINQKNQDPIKAKGEYNKDTGLITVQVTYSQYRINKIILENEHELAFTKTNKIITADTTGIELEDGINTITIIDKQGNTKELEIQVISHIYVAYYSDGEILAFGKSTNPIPDKGAPSASYGDISDKSYSVVTSIPWNNQRAKITTVEFVDKISPISTVYWFYDCTNLTTINNIENLNTSNVTNMKGMFYCCSSLKTLDVSKFNTSNVTGMTNMFALCRNLAELDVSSFDTSNVTIMDMMFYNCSSLKTLDVSKFDTSNVTTMYGMFNTCSSLTELDVSKFDASNVKTMAYMFSHCSSLTELDVSKFDTSNVTNMAYMFSYCSSLTKLDLSSFNTSNVTDMGRMFYDCTSLSQITFGEKWDKTVTLPSPTRGVYKCTGWYSDANFTTKVAEAGGNYTPAGPITIYADVPSDIYVKLYEDGTLAFCSNNSQIPFKTLNQDYDYGNIVGKVFNNSEEVPWKEQRESITTAIIIDEISPVATAYWFCECTNLTTINNMENLNTNKVTNMANMFYNCTSLTQITFGENWNKSVTLPIPTREGYKCVGWYSDANFTTKVAEAGANYTPSGAITIYANFVPSAYAVLYTDGTLAFGTTENPIPDKGEPSASYGDISYKTFSSVNDIPWYSDRPNITTVEFVDKISPVSTAWWFYNCTNLTTINNIENLNTSNVTNMTWMFGECRSLIELDLSSFDTSNVTDMLSIFCECRSLKSLDLSKFDTSNVTSMYYMFYNCSSLKTLDLSKFDTSNVKDMSCMFCECSSLTKLDVGDFKTSNVTDMNNMFRGCSSLTELDLRSFDVSKATMRYMFYNCTNLKTIYVNQSTTMWPNISNVTNNSSSKYYYIFENCGTNTTNKKVTITRKELTQNEDS